VARLYCPWSSSPTPLNFAALNFLIRVSFPHGESRRRKRCWHSLLSDTHDTQQRQPTCKAENKAACLRCLQGATGPMPPAAAWAPLSPLC
jgi:hypothetical protein